MGRKKRSNPKKDLPKLRKIKKKRVAKKRKNFFPTLIAIVISWGLVAFMVYFIDPEVFGIIPVFFLTVFFALLFSLSILFGNTRSGLIIASATTLFLILRYFGIGNLLNLLLIAGISISIGLYLHTKN